MKNKKLLALFMLFALQGFLFCNYSTAQNVGIGTAAPIEKMDVIGNIRSSNLAGVGYRLVYSDANGVLTNNFGTASPAWLTLGNAGTNASTNFIGTADAVDWVVKTSNVEQMRVLAAGNVGIGIAAPTAKLHVQVASGIAIRGTQTGFGSGYLGYSGSITLGTFGTTPGAVVFSEEGTATANPSLIAVTRSPATYAANIAYSDVWIAGYFGVDNATTGGNPPAVYGQLNVTNSSLGGIQSGLRGLSARGTTAGNPGFSVGVSGLGWSQNQNSIGVVGTSITDQLAFNQTCIPCGGWASSGGYFDILNYAQALNYSYAYVAQYNGATIRKIIGAGSVSEIVPTENHGRITLTSPESPEYWYIDYGTARLVNGRAHISIDPILAEIIVVDADNPLKVFPQVNIQSCLGVAIINKTAQGFDIVEINNGTSNGEVDYQIVAKPKTNYGEGRFPQAPGPIGAPKELPLKARAKNQLDASKIFRWPPDNIVYGYELPKQAPESVLKKPEKK